MYITYGTLSFCLSLAVESLSRNYSAFRYQSVHSRLPTSSNTNWTSFWADLSSLGQAVACRWTDHERPWSEISPRSGRNCRRDILAWSEKIDFLAQTRRFGALTLKVKGSRHFSPTALFCTETRLVPFFPARLIPSFASTKLRANLFILNFLAALLLLRWSNTFQAARFCTFILWIY